jgi:hypothetical protein
MTFNRYYRNWKCSDWLKLRKCRASVISLERKAGSYISANSFPPLLSFLPYIHSDDSVSGISGNK